MDFIIIILAVLLEFAKLILVSLLIVAVWLYIKDKSPATAKKITKTIKREREQRSFFQLNNRTNTYNTMTNLLKQCEQFVDTKQGKPNTKADLLDTIKANNNAMLDYVSTIQNLLHKAQKRDK